MAAVWFVRRKSPTFQTQMVHLCLVSTPVIVAFCDLGTESICLPQFAPAREKWHAS